MSPTTAQLQIRQLAAKARVFGLADNPVLLKEHQRVLTEADQAKRLLSSAELRDLCANSGTGAAALEQLQDQVEALVDASRKALLGKQPELVQPGGALYPEDRAEACWRDCYHFLRVSCYGAACAESAICDPDGMAALGELYALLGVPTDALQLALIELRTRACAAYADAGAAPQEVDVLKGAIAELERWISRFCG